MTRPISLKSTRLEILLEVTEDRGIESGGWGLLQQTALSSVEGVDADLMKRTGVRIEEYFISYVLSVLKRSVGSQHTKRRIEGRIYGEYQESG